jgi:hypothetical protein
MLFLAGRYAPALRADDHAMKPEPHPFHIAVDYAESPIARSRRVS